MYHVQGISSICTALSNQSYSLPNIDNFRHPFVQHCPINRTLFRTLIISDIDFNDLYPGSDEQERHHVFDVDLGEADLNQDATPHNLILQCHTNTFGNAFPPKINYLLNCDLLK